MSGRKWLLTGAATVVSMAAGVLVGLLPADEYESGDDGAAIAAASEVEPGDRIGAAIDGVQDDGFYIAPNRAGDLTDAEVNKAEAAIADADVPVFVAWMGDAGDGGYYTDYDGLDQLRAGVGQKGFYILFGKDGPISGAVGYDGPYADADLAMGRPGEGLVRYINEIAAQPATTSPENDYWGGTAGGIGAGLLFVALGYGALILIVWITGLVAGKRKAR